MMHYLPNDYNTDNVLKVPVTLIVVLTYQLKYFFVLFLPNVIPSPALAKFAHEQFSLGLWLSCIPALVVMLAMSRRVPEAGPTVRWLWQRGRGLLLASFILDISLLGIYALLGIRKFEEISLMFLYIDIALIVFLLRSPRIKDVFAEFPEAKKP